MILTMAAKHSSIGIELTVGGQKINGLTDIPDMGATPEKLDVTTLADEVRKYISGVKDFGDLEFTFIYESGADGNYAVLNGIAEEADNKEGKTACSVAFPDGASFAFEGEISLRIVGVGVNAVITFVMSVALSKDIEYKAGA
jgi:hypothetical protein